MMNRYGINPQDNTVTRYLKIRNWKIANHEWPSYSGGCEFVSRTEERMYVSPLRSFAKPADEELSWDDVVKVYEDR